MGKNYLRLTGIVLLALMGVMVTASYAQKDAPQKQLTELEEKEKNGTIKLKERAQLAKAKGQKKIVAPGRVSLFPTFRDEQELSENISNYTLVIAQPTRVRAYLDGERIRTWYKFKVLETLSQAPPKLWHISRQAPDELLPVSEDEVLIHREGGGDRG